MKKAIAILAAVVAVVLVVGIGSAFLPVAGGTTSPATPVDTDRVDMPPSYRFDPPAIRVKAGTTVTWTNDDNFTHSVKLLDSGEDHVVKPGESTTFTFAQPGTYKYTCSFHSTDMNGEVIVVAP